MWIAIARVQAAMLVVAAGAATLAPAEELKSSTVKPLKIVSREEWRLLQRGDPGTTAETDGRGRRSSPPSPSPSPSTSYRTYDGRGNNPAHPDWGTAGSNYLREASGAAYADGRSVPPGADRPSPRLISNVLVDQGDLGTEDERAVATTTYEFGQFLDHDFGLAQGGSTESFDIPVPAGDPYFDPESTGTALIFLDRSAFDPSTGARSARQQVNTVTAYIDGSQIYGSNAARAAWLRTFSGGQLKVRSTSAGELLPLNDGTQANDNPVGLPATTLGVAGDVRSNEQPGLTTLHVAFLREHNRQALRLARKNRSWSDERLYQEARRIVGAELQFITYNEFLPALLGRRLPAYRGYRSNVNPGLSNVFATAAFRVGHSMVGDDIDVVDVHFEEVEVLELSDAFFNPDAIPGMGGIDPIIRYMCVDTSQRIDNTIVGPLRNFLFGPPGAGGFDLAALNIQRGRDHGLPSYNQIRADFGLRKVRTFSEITPNAETAAKLQELYGSVDKIDAWVGMLAEPHLRGSSLGATHTAVLVDQFTRLRDGDRFWYQIAGFSSSDLAMIERTTLGGILEANSAAVGLQPNVFKVCIADFNHSGNVTRRDRDDFMAAYNDGSEDADLNEDGVVDRTDLDEFSEKFAEGC